MVRKPDPLKWLGKPSKKLKPFISEDVESTWNKQERELAEVTGGRRTAGSGNKLDKGDVVTASFRYEAKSTDKESISIKLDWLEKIVSEAINTGKSPALAIHFSKAALPCGKDWILIERELFLEKFDEHK